MAVLLEIKAAKSGDATASIAILEYTVNPASIGAASLGDTVVTATGEVKAGDEILFLSGPAAMLGAVSQGTHTVTADAFTWRISNASAGAVDLASGLYRFLRIRP
jgi:hypothetical protein